MSGPTALPASTLALWAAYDRLEPWAAPADDERTALLAYLLAEPNRDAKLRPQPFTPADFLPARGTPRSDSVPRKAAKQTQTPHDMILIAEAVTRALGGTDRRRRRVQHREDERG